jgi:uncharacterized RDD family membrane protein YckC
MSETPAGPGWYDDPEDATQLRYFDGVVWTAHTTPRRSPTAEASTIGRAVQTPPAAPPGWGRPPAPPPGQGQWPGGSMRPTQGYGGAYGQPWGTRRDLLPDGAVLAEWWRRLLARIVDGFVVGLVTAIVAFPWLGDLIVALGTFLDQSLRAAESGGAAPDQGAFQSEVTAVVLPITIASVVVALIYEVGFLVWRSATPGKMLLGTKVRPAAANGPVSLVVALRRQAISVATSLLGIVPYLGFFGSILSILDPAWLLWDPRRQALHDKVADTVVVLRDRAG